VSSLSRPPVATSSNRVQTAFRRFAWGVLAFNVLVVGWGAYVRASGSGDGCGNNWPFCNGQVVPQSPRIQTLIEFSHRISSALAVFAVVALSVWAYRAFPRKHQIRLFALLSGVFILLEGALGAGLVLFRFVAQNASSGRAFYLSAHLTNTMLLLGSLALVAWLAGDTSGNLSPLQRRNLPRLLGFAVVVALVVSITGAIAALGDTLYPAVSLQQGVQQDFASGSSVLLRLRLFHPLVAILSSFFLLYVALRIPRRRPGQAIRVSSAIMALVIVFQLAMGVINVYLLAPIWMQLLHLFIADVLMIVTVVLAAETMVYPVRATATPSR
jgi:cytochrome c oxidase assembly protein subunit 15